MPPGSSKLWIPGSSNIPTRIEKHLTKHVRRKEVLSLYREILRTAKHFHWKDEKSGKPWNLILKENAKKEFLESKNENDPLIIARMLITGRDCLQQIQNKFYNATNAAWKRIEQDSKNYNYNNNNTSNNTSKNDPSSQSSSTDTTTKKRR